MIEPKQMTAEECRAYVLAALRVYTQDRFAKAPSMSQAVLEEAYGEQVAQWLKGRIGE